jgi:hypothetical protein
MVSAMRGVEDARLTTSLAAFVVNRRDDDRSTALAGSRARNRVSKSARFRHAAHGRQSAEYSGFCGGRTRGGGPRPSPVSTHAVMADSRLQARTADCLMQRVSNYPIGNVKTEFLKFVNFIEGKKITSTCSR